MIGFKRVAARSVPDDWQCAICQEEAQRHRAVVAAACDVHTFHEACLGRWGRPECPLCRQTVPAVGGGGKRARR